MSQATKAIIRSRFSGHGVKTELSGYSRFACDQMDEIPSGPVAPSNLSATGYVETIVLTWSRPTKNQDGSDCPVGSLSGYYVYNKAGSAPSSSDYDNRWFVDSETHVHNVVDTSTQYYKVSALNNDDDEGVLSDAVSAHATYILKGGDDITGPTGGLYIGGDYIGYYDPDATGGGAWIAYIANNGDFFLGGAAGSLQWDYSETSLIVKGTYKSSDSGERIEVDGVSTGADAHWLYARDSGGNARAGVDDTGFYLWGPGGKEGGSLVLSLPSTGATGAYMTYDEVLFHNSVIIGTSVDPATSDDLYVDGPARLGGGSTVNGTLVVGDHSSTGSIDQVVNVCYGTGDPPSAATVTEGTIYIKHAS